MATTTETATLVSGDVAIEKRETFDVDFAAWLLEQKGRLSSDDRATLRAYYKARKNGNQHDTLYKLGKDIKHEFLGRFIAKGGIGLQCLPRDIRAALAQKYYWDVDMRNAQPTLLVQYAEKRGWVCAKVKHYNQYREELLTEMMETFGIERDEAKCRVTSLCFGMIPSPDRYTPFFVNEFQPELSVLMKNVWAERKEDIGSVAKRGVRSVMAYVLQTEERKVLLAMEASLAKQGRLLEVYIHDGGLVRKKEGETHLPEEVLRKVERDVEVTTGYKISLAVKPMLTTFERDEDEDDLLPADVIVDDKYAAQAFVKVMGDLFVMDNEVLWVFNAETGMWSNSRSVLERVITSLNGKLVFRQMGATGVRTFDYSGCVEKRSSLIKMLPSVAPVRDGFFRTRLSSDKNKILFKDGIYDFATKTFTKGFDPNVVFYAACPRNFPAVKDSAKVAFVHHACFEAPFKDAKEAKRLSHNLMRAMIGDWRRKTFVTALGPKNSGKSVLIFLAKTTFGNFVGEFNANSMLLRHGGEAERDLLWTSSIYSCRFAFSSEIKQDDSKQMPAIDGNMLKRLVSGGSDTISFRRMNVNDADKVFFRPTIFILANDLPKITPCSEEINDRLQVVDYHYSFQTKPTELHHKPVDKSISEKFAQEDYADAFFWLLTEEYETWEREGFPELPPCETELQEDLMEQANVKNILLGRFELTGKDDDQVDAKEVQTYLRQCGYIGSETKITREMKQIGLGTDRVRRGRQRVKVYTGLKEE